ncbi:MAG: OmpA family protein [Bryobacteraceae bacterium]
MVRNLILIGTVTVCFLTAAACHKAVPVAARPEPPAPVAASSPTPTAASVPKPVAMRPTNGSTALTPQNDRRTMPPEVRASLNEHLARLEDALFDFDKYTISTNASTALKDDVSVIREILAAYPQQKLLIEGHADERGSSEYNLALGDKRARAAEEFLSTMGIPANQLTVISYGKDRPVCTEQTEGCWQKNRRAHITAALN